MSISCLKRVPGNFNGERIVFSTNDAVTTRCLHTPKKCSIGRPWTEKCCVRMFWECTWYWEKLPDYISLFRWGTHHRTHAQPPCTSAPTGSVPSMYLCSGAPHRPSDGGRWGARRWSIILSPLALVLLWLTQNVTRRGYRVRKTKAMWRLKRK